MHLTEAQALVGINFEVSIEPPETFRNHKYSNQGRHFLHLVGISYHPPLGFL
jgi:hypothetical protein